MSKSSFETLTLNQKNITDFAEARNNLLTEAKADWVFFVDSDEVASDSLASEINNLQLTIKNKFSGYYVKRENYFRGKYIGTDTILRLGRKNAGLWERRVHEVWKIDGPVGYLKNPLVHTTAKSLSDYITKLNFYANLHAKANKEEGKKSGLFKIIFYPQFKFFQSLLMGRGVVFSILQSFHSFLAWSELWLLTKNG